MKYRRLIEALEDHVLYTPAMIAAFAEENNFLESGDEAKQRLSRQRIRIALGRFSNNHDFPDAGDGIVTLRGQAPTPAWYGWRWKSALR